MLVRRLWAAAVLVYLCAWLLPSIVFETPQLPFEQGPSHTEAVRGWEATRVALSPLLPRYFASAPWPSRLLMVASGLSNLLFVACVFLAFRRPQRVTPGWEAAVWGMALLNTWWFVAFSFGEALRVGYYLWVLSFVLLALALRATRRARARPRIGQAALALS